MSTNCDQCKANMLNSPKFICDPCRKRAKESTKLTAEGVMIPHSKESWDEAQRALGCAAANSYLRHCGQNALRCAQGDLLGEMLEALRELLAEQNGPPLIRSESQWRAAVKRAEAAIAKAEGHT